MPSAVRPSSCLTWALLAALVAALAWSGPAEAVTRLKPGKRLQIKKPVRQTAKINALNAADPVGVRMSPRLMAPDLERAKARRATRALRRAKARAGARRLRSTVLPDMSPTGFSTWTGLSGVSRSPSDANGAINQTHYVEATNDGVAAYDRATHALVSSATLGTFTNAQGADPGSTASPCDPYVIWDDTSQRFFYTAIRCDTSPTNGATANRLYVGWSKTSNPTNFTTGWCQYAIDTGRNIYDYPKLGQNALHIAMGYNAFDVPSNFTYVRSGFVSMRKPPAGPSNCDVPSPPGMGDFVVPSTYYTPVPANMHDNNADGYVPMTGSIAPSTTIGHVKFSGANTTSGLPTAVLLADTTVESYTPPTSAPMPASPFTLDTLDGRLTNAVGGTDPSAGGADSVWTQHTVNGAGNRSVVRWYELTYNPGSELRQTGTESSADQHVFNGAISPTTSGDEAILQYNASGTVPPQFPQIITVYRTPEDPLGSMTGRRWIYTSNRSSNDFSCQLRAGECRWGDYASMQPDPANAHAVWGSSQIVPVTSQQADWTTRNFGMSTSEVDVSFSSGTVDVTAGVDQVNRLTLTESGAQTRVSEASWPTLRAGPNCGQVNVAQVVCPLGLISVKAGDMRDRVTNNTTFRSRIEGGAGPDMLTGSDAITGSGDTIVGDGGADSLSGRGGDDTLEAADGEADTLIDCGAGTNDTAVIDAGLDPAPVGCENVVS